MPKTASPSAKAKPKPPKPKPARRRLDADTARELILDATEKRLVTVGPAGIRLQEVAADSGVSHPTVLHHFGSRELLVKAVIARALRGVHANLIEAMAHSGGEPAKLEAMLENVAKALGSSGYSRVILWLALEGHHFDEPEVPLHAVVDAAHAMRLQRKRHNKRPTREDTARTVVLATIAIVCGSVLVPSLLENAGLSAGPAEESRFRSWLTRLLVEHIEQ